MQTAKPRTSASPRPEITTCQLFSSKPQTAALHSPPQLRAKPRDPAQRQPSLPLPTVLTMGETSAIYGGGVFRSHHPEAHIFTSGSKDFGCSKAFLLLYFTNASNPNT